MNAIKNVITKIKNFFKALVKGFLYICLAVMLFNVGDALINPEDQDPINVYRTPVKTEAQKAAENEAYFAKLEADKAQKEINEKAEAEAAAREVMASIERKKADLIESIMNEAKYGGQFQNAIKEQLKDPSSFERVNYKATYINKEKLIFRVALTYRAKNSFGGYVVNTIKADWNGRTNQYSNIVEG